MNKFITIQEAQKQSEAKTNLIADNFRERLVTMEKKFDQKIDGVENKIDRSKMNVIETLGIFVALFTFISVEFQAFRTLNSHTSIAGLCLILLGALLLFILILDILLNITLPMYQYKKIPGIDFNPLKGLIGHEEQIQLSILNPRTWGAGFTLRIILIIIAISLILVGIFLLSDDGNKLLSKPDMTNQIYDLRVIDQTIQK